MQYKTLGNTGLLVSNICLGAMTFSGAQGIWKNIGQVDQAGADEFFRVSIEAGVNFIDTANVYSEGESEKTVGQSLKNVGIARKDVVIATKAFGRMGPGRNDVGASRGHLMHAVEASLRRLDTDYIDLYQIHGTDLVTPIEETLRALDTLVQHGKVRYIGVSNWNAWRIMKALGISEQKNLAKIRYSAGLLFHRRPRPGARDCSAARRSEDRPAGVESVGRWPALRQIYT